MGTICDFLGKIMPNGVAFPHRNEMEILKAVIRAAVMTSMRRATMNVFIVDAIVYGTGWAT